MDANEIDLTRLKEKRYTILNNIRHNKISEFKV